MVQRTNTTERGEPTLGFCTWLLRGLRLPDAIAFLAEAGYRSVAFLQDVMGVRGSEREEAAAAIRELGFSITYHGCVQWWVGQDQRFDDAKVQAMFEDVRWWHENAGGVVSCCSDRVAGPTAEGPNRRYLEGETRRLAQCERDFFEPLGVGYGIENCFHRYCLHEEMRGLKDSVRGPAPHLGSILDVGHAFVHVNVDRTDGLSFEDYLDGIPVRIWELHITDNHGASDEHLAPGEGTLDFRALRRAMDRRGFDGPISMEVCKDAAHGDNCFDLSNPAHRDAIRRMRDDFLRLYVP